MIRHQPKAFEPGEQVWVLLKSGRKIRRASWFPGRVESIGRLKVTVLVVHHSRVGANKYVKRAVLPEQLRKLGETVDLSKPREGGL